MAARKKQENHVTRYPVILYRSVVDTHSEMYQIRCLFQCAAEFGQSASAMCFSSSLETKLSLAIGR